MEYFEAVKAIIIDKLGVDESEVTLEADFSNDLAADSLDMVELIMEFEKLYGDIPEKEQEKMKTVADVISYLEKIPAK